MHKTIVYDFEFGYPRAGGTQDVANSITVCEPTWHQRQIYTTVRSYLGETGRLLTLAFADAPRPAQTDAAKDEPKETSDEAPKAAEIDQLERMRFALSTEAFGRAYDYFVKALTDCKALAFVGDDFENRSALNEVVWTNIAKAGGMEAVDKVLSTWLSFFDSTSRARATGTTVTSGFDSPSEPPPSPTGPSKSRKH